MKIDDSLNGVPPLRARDTRKAKTRTDAGNPSAVPADSVELTPAAAQFGRLRDELQTLDTSSADKVEAVRQAIAEGRFQVDEDAVAEALVRDTLDLLRRRGGGLR